MPIDLCSYLPYYIHMSTQHTPVAPTVNMRELADTTYTIVISERQLHYIRLALREFVANDPGEELDEFGMDIPTNLEEMLADPLEPSPCVNGFVI